MTSRKRYLEQESREEMQAVCELGSTSFNDIVRLNELGETWASYEEKRNKKGDVVKTSLVNVRAQDVGSISTWNAFIVSKGYSNASLISLTDGTVSLTEEFYTFLTTDYTDRYQNLDMEGKVWLRRVVRLAARFHLMENKSAGYERALSGMADDEDYMCNSYAAFCWRLLQGIRLSQHDVARQVHHIMKTPEQATLYIQDFFEEHYRRVHSLLLEITPTSEAM